MEWNVIIVIIIIVVIVIIITIITIVIIIIIVVVVYMQARWLQKVAPCIVNSQWNRIPIIQASLFVKKGIVSMYVIMNE